MANLSVQERSNLFGSLFARALLGAGNASARTGRQPKLLLESEPPTSTMKHGTPPWYQEQLKVEVPCQRAHRQRRHQ
jgi:hypothetical protein